MVTIAGFPSLGGRPGCRSGARPPRPASWGAGRAGRARLPRTDPPRAAAPATGRPARPAPLRSSQGPRRAAPPAEPHWCWGPDPGPGLPSWEATWRGGGPCRRGGTRGGAGTL